MVLSEAEAEARLSDLRRQRESIERAISDLTLYLELGRRLRSAPAESGLAADPATGRAPLEPDRTAFANSSEPPPTQAAGMAAPSRLPPAAPETKAVPDPRPPFGADDPGSGTVPEGALARRYGRALIQAAVAVLEEAGRPLHVSEILDRLGARGFSIPGQQDPVAGLNTRLWKRSGPSGPLRRLGDAVYALPDSAGSEPE